MKKRFFITLKAEEEVFNAVLYIANDDPDTAYRFYSAFRATCHLLADIPEAGRSLNPFLQSPKHARLFPVKGFDKYLIFYRVTSHGIEILRVLHSRRDIQAILEEE